MDGEVQIALDPNKHRHSLQLLSVVSVDDQTWRNLTTMI